MIEHLKISDILGPYKSEEIKGAKYYVFTIVDLTNNLCYELFFYKLCDDTYYLRYTSNTVNLFNYLKNLKFNSFDEIKNAISKIIDKYNKLYLFS